MKKSSNEKKSPKNQDLTFSTKIELFTRLREISHDDSTRILCGPLVENLDGISFLRHPALSARKNLANAETRRWENSLLKVTLSCHNAVVRHFGGFSCGNVRSSSTWRSGFFALGRKKKIRDESVKNRLRVQSECHLATAGKLVDERFRARRNESRGMSRREAGVGLMLWNSCPPVCTSPPIFRLVHRNVLFLRRACEEFLARKMGKMCGTGRGKL